MSQLTKILALRAKQNAEKHAHEAYWEAQRQEHARKMQNDPVYRAAEEKLERERREMLRDCVVSLENAVMRDRMEQGRRVDEMANRAEREANR